MNKIIKKKLFKIEFDLASALAIGSGENALTDKDIILGSDKKPYIPASAIAGVCISALDAGNSPENRIYRDYWGYIDKAEDKSETKDSLFDSIESRIIFYDACLKNDQIPEVTVRDSVALDEYKTAKTGAKFDMEVVEPGIRFTTYIEQSFFNDNDPELGQAITDLFLKGNLQFGAKTSKGYGSIENVKSWTYELRFDKTDESSEKAIVKWAKGELDNLLWNSNNSEMPVDLTSKIKTIRKIEIDLAQVGGISVRKYTTEASENGAVPDFTQLTSTCIRSGEKIVSKPIIPGTSWAGAFIHQIEKNSGLKRTTKKTDEQLIPNDLDSLFGYVIGGKKQKSRIYFSESIIENAKPKQISRNAIDRFSGGTKDGALFTERTYYGGTTKLVIGIDGDATISDDIAKAFAASIVDLHYGFMAVGGEASIGRGLFTITAIDGIKKIPDLSDSEEMGKAGSFFDEVFNLIKG